MNRVIKFRGWEPATDMGKAGNMSYNQEFCLSQILHPDRIEIMQFTGMTDKNGKEIYEGDILNSKRFDPVEYNPEMGRFESNLGGAHVFSMHEFYEDGAMPKIIGNIYENSDLLK